MKNKYWIAMPIGIFALGLGLLWFTPVYAQAVCDQGQVDSDACGGCIVSPIPTGSCNSPQGGSYNSCGECRCTGSQPTDSRNNCDNVCTADHEPISRSCPAGQRYD